MEIKKNNSKNKKRSCSCHHRTWKGKNNKRHGDGTSRRWSSDEGLYHPIYERGSVFRRVGWGKIIKSLCRTDIDRKRILRDRGKYC